MQTTSEKIRNSNKIIVAADKTTNFYEIPLEEHNRTILNNVTKSYRKCNTNLVNEINTEAKSIAQKLNLEKKINTLTEQQAFITIKDHKENFLTSPKYRLINPTKTEIGKISKTILDKINTQIRKATHTNQWQNTSSTIEWFKGITNKNECKFIIFDIVDFYPSISKQLLLNSIEYAKTITTIDEDDIKIILHARRSILYHDGEPWIKRNGDGDFDVTMGSNDGAEVCELVGLFLLSQIHRIIDKKNVGLYRDDGLGVLRNVSGPQGEQTRKKLIDIFKNNGLKIEISISKITNFLDVTFNLENSSYKTFHKPNNQPLYIHCKSNHPPSVINQIPKSVSKRLSTNSATEAIFNESAPFYNDALKSSGHTETIKFKTEVQSNGAKKRQRKRNIIWFNPPYSKNVKNQVGKYFLKLIEKHFGNKEHKLNKIFNKNTVKVSYGCTENVERIIKSHNQRISTKPKSNETNCNCQRKPECPLNGKCLSENIVYAAYVNVIETPPQLTSPNTETQTQPPPTRTTRTRHNLRPRTQPTNPTTTQTTNEETNNEPQPATMTPQRDIRQAHHTERVYIGAAENFKNRYRNHVKSFNNIRYKNDTELSKYLWALKLDNKNYSIKWSILKKTSGYNKATKLCNLCTREKLEICLYKNKTSLLNKRNELISKCRHENKHLLANLPDP